MCTKCKEIYDKAKERGISDEEFQFWYWNETPLPVGEPTEEQVAALFERAPKR